MSWRTRVLYSMVTFLLSGLNLAQATTLEELFFPDPIPLIAACDQGYETQSQNTFETYLLRLNASPVVTLQPPLATAYVRCMNAAKNKKPVPRVAATAISAVVYVHGRVQSLEEARGIKADLVLRDATGQELVRFTPIADSTIAAENQWKRDCPAENNCTWVGRNLLQYSVPESSRRDLTLETNTLVVVVDRLGQREEYVVPRKLDRVGGPLDVSFGKAGRVLTDFDSGRALAMKVRAQTDGKFIVAGTVGLNGQTEFGLVRYGRDGRSDASFGDNGRVSQKFGMKGCWLSDFLIQADGRIVIVGYAKDALGPGSGDDVVFMRLTSTGSLDKSFGNNGSLVGNFGGNDRPTAIVAQADGQLVIVGNARTAKGSRIFVSRIAADGRPDQTFADEAVRFIDLGSGSEANAIALQADGKILVAGTDGTAGANDFDFLLVRLETDGRFDAGFGREGRITTSFGKDFDEVQALLVQPDGTILAVGYARNGKQYNLAMARYQSNGRLDSSFAKQGLALEVANTNTFAFAVTLLPDGRIVVVGASGATGNEDLLVMRYQANGQPDSSFAAQSRYFLDLGAEEIAISVLVDSGAALVVGSSGAGSRSQFVILRFLP
jgi:uncharacterized delta-60 repeat protein